MLTRVKLNHPRRWIYEEDVACDSRLTVLASGNIRLFNLRSIRGLWNYGS